MTSAESVKDRLKNLQKGSHRILQEFYNAYGLERTVYRLSISKYSERFTLKGGIFLYALYDGKYARVTSDIDLLASDISNDENQMYQIFKEIFSIEYDDALRYDLDTLRVRSITEFKKYHGVNISVMAYLDRTRIPVSIDIGFGDVIYPERTKISFPVLLDMEAPYVYAYSIYTTVAEKFEAIVANGDANSRYKDFYDIYVLTDRYEMDGRLLKEAILETFEHRNTTFDEIVAFSDAFAENAIHQSRWKSFVKKKRAMEDVTLEGVLLRIKTLLDPIVKSILEKDEFNYVWDQEAHCWIEKNV